jgi:hypothetical protein
MEASMANFKKVGKMFDITTLLFLLVAGLMLKPEVVRAETPVRIDPQVLKQFQEQVQRMNQSKRKVASSSSRFEPTLADQVAAFNAAEEGSKAQKKAADELTDVLLDAIEAKIEPLSNYSQDLEKMQAVNAAAAKSAKPDSASPTGKAQEVKAFNDLVVSMSGWDEVFDTFDTPELRRSSKQIKESLRGMKNELLIARANHNQIFRTTFKNMDARLLDYRLRLNDYIGNLKAMVKGIVQARQAGVYTDTFVLLEQLIGSIDDSLIPTFLGPEFGQALQVISAGGVNGTGGSSTGGKAIGYDDLYIKD